MSNTVKITLYVVLIVLASVSGFFALAQWKAVMDRPRDGTTELERIEPERPNPAVNASVDPAATNLSTTNLASAGVTNGFANSAGSNENGAGTNTVSVTSAPPEAAEQNLENVPGVATALGSRGPASEKEGGKIGFWSGMFLLSLVGLGFLVAMDVAQFFGNRTLKVLYNDEGDGVSNPEYEAAEQAWANGEHLEAIRMMREYLQKNPREQYVALRIAEIYEKDLGNYLASALEYEEVLKHRLSPDRWGWAAIHLCNLYFKLNQEEKAFRLLRRIVKDHPNVPAADKARKRLEQVDAPAEIYQEDPTEARVKTLPAAGEAEQPKSNLPPGFRPRK